MNEKDMEKVLEKEIEKDLKKEIEQGNETEIRKKENIPCFPKVKQCA